MKVTTSIVPMMDEAWGDWAKAVNNAINMATKETKMMCMGFFCLEMLHFL